MTADSGFKENAEKTTDWTIVKVPYGGGYCSLNLAQSKNTRVAPDSLEREFKRQKLFLHDNGKPIKNPEWHQFDIDYWRQNSHQAWKRMDNVLFKRSKNLFYEPGTNVLFLGGSHTISYTTISALCAYAQEPIGLIVLDAHPDCCDKANWPIHSDWLRKLIERGIILPDNVLILGLRQIEMAELEFLSTRGGIKHYKAGAMLDPKNFVRDCFGLREILNKLKSLKACYLSIDIDVISAAYASGTRCPNFGGLSDIEILSLIRQVKKTLPSLRAVDLVEISPLTWQQRFCHGYDPTVDLGVQIIREIIS